MSKESLKRKAPRRLPLNREGEVKSVWRMSLKHAPGTRVRKRDIRKALEAHSQSGRMEIGISASNAKRQGDIVSTLARMYLHREFGSRDLSLDSTLSWPRSVLTTIHPVVVAWKGVKISPRGLR